MYQTSKLDAMLNYYYATWFKRHNPEKNMMLFQEEMEQAFMLDANPSDIKEFPEAKKLYKQILKSRRIVNQINRLSKEVLCINE